jgi:hypothetical protein
VKRFTLFFACLVGGCIAVAFALVSAHIPSLWTALILLAGNLAAILLFASKYLRKAQLRGAVKERIALVCCPVATLFFISPLVQVIRNRHTIPLAAALVAAGFYVFMIWLLGFSFVRVLKRLNSGSS